jgi:chromosome segregation ATPase
MAGGSRAASSHDSETAAGDYERAWYGSGGTRSDLLSTLEPAWENAIRDWLIPLNLDTNHGYAKEHVVNSELVKRQGVAQGRQQRLERLARACRARLTDLREQDQHLQEQVHAYEQRWSELSLQVMPFEATGQTEERDYFPLKARQVATEWEVRKPQSETGKARRAEPSSLDQM